MAELLSLSAVVFGTMLIEARRAAANERAQRARGGREPPGDVYKLMRAAYPGAFAAMLVEGEKWDEAIALLRPAVGRHGNDAGLHTNLALALAGKGDAGWALKLYEIITHQVSPTPILAKPCPF